MARATYTAAQRGRYVVLCETGGASSRVGMPFKYEMYQLAGACAKFCRDAALDV